MSAIIEIKATPTFADYYRLNLHALRWRIRVGLLLSFLPICSMVYLSLVYVTRGGFGEGFSFLTLLGYLGFMPLLFALTAVRVHFRIKETWRSVAAIREPRTFRFTDCGLEIEAITTRGSVDWENFTSVSTLGHLILLRISQNLYHMLPTEDLSAADLEALKSLLRDKVKDSSGLR